MKRMWLQIGYEVVVRLHPRWFRERFGDEMVWIFEQESRRGGTARLFLDGMVSVARQRWRPEGCLEPVAAGIGLLEAGPGMAPRRLVEGSLVSTLLLAGALVLLGQRGRPFAEPACLPGSPPAMPRRVLRAPTQVAPLAEVERSSPRRTGAAAVDSSAASAVRIARAQEGHGFATAGYCTQTDVR